MNEDIQRAMAEYELRSKAGTKGSGSAAPVGEKLGQWRDICVCGHLTTAHMKQGTEYASCWANKGWNRCLCTGGDRPVAQTRVGDLGRFRSLSRGSTYPSALDEGISKMRNPEKNLRRLVTACDECGQEQDFSKGLFQLEAYSLGPNGGVMGLDELKGSKIDTGRHVMLCGVCAQRHRLEGLAHGV